ncbi:hypothetical protein ACQ9ZG_27870 [Streptomyces araujoniae]|uniref:hypothetical protein n=1 Tax=Streptomyces sp. ZEA17I TaxID=2202516 RepID=UPI0015E83267|nr:hypothetical protein [Streptomyces sp. ZEA17I]
MAVGRAPDTIRILPGIVPVIGDTEAEVRELEAELDRIFVPKYAKRRLALRLKIAPEELDLDAELLQGIFRRLAVSCPVRNRKVRLDRSIEDG